MSRVVWSEIYGGENDAVDRAAAMQVPSIVRARNLIVSTVADTPLRAFNRDGAVANQPTWLYRTNGAVSPYHRMVWTLDDLIFYGMSLWEVQRGADGLITDAARVPFHRWGFDKNSGRILVDNKPVDESEVIVIAGAGEGLLATGGDTIKGARAIDRSWIGRVQSPVPMTELRQTTNDQLEQAEVQQLVRDWQAARTSPTGAVGFVPYGIELHTHGESDSALYIEGRNAIRLDVGNLLNIPASLLDGSTAAASLTYETTEGRRNDYYDTTIPYWVAPIEAALSQDNVVPRGQRVRFDFTDALSIPASPIGDPSVED